jgi:hypothetical protein
MISPHAILDSLRAAPFVKVAGTVLVIFTFLSQEEGIFDRWETASLALIERFTYLDTVTA